jgi:AcrR family transcriptional regulator
VRKKSEERRDAIITAAVEVFCESGYEAASMSTIAARVGGSKATLYNYFTSKEEILLAVLLAYGERHAHDIFDLLLTNRTDSLETNMVRFGTAYLKLVTAEKTIALLRLVIAENVRGEIGRRFYEAGQQTAWAKVESLFAAAIQEGKLRKAKPRVMAEHLKGLYGNDMWRCLVAGTPQLTDAEARRSAQAITEMFMRAYGADRKAP